MINPKARILSVAFWINLFRLVSMEQYSILTNPIYGFYFPYKLMDEIWEIGKKDTPVSYDCLEPGGVHY